MAPRPIVEHDSVSAEGSGPIEEQYHAEDPVTEQAAAQGRAPVPPPYAPPRGGPFGPAQPPRSQAGALPPPPLEQVGAPTAPPSAAADGRAGWGWGLSLAGLAVGFGPEALLYAAALGMGTSTSTGKVTIGSAVALVIGSLVVYGWQTLAAWFF